MRLLVFTVLVSMGAACGPAVTREAPSSGLECSADCDCAHGNPCIEDACDGGMCVERSRDGLSCERFAGTCRGGWCCNGDACFDPSAVPLGCAD